MHDFTLPANIKQIGSIGSGIRIYMEDYVCTFLHQYATSGGYDERLAYLVGRHMLIDGQSFLFISGAIYGMYAETIEGITRFTQKSADYAEAMLDEYFPGKEIVGWMQSQPSYGTYLNQHYGAYHLRQFTKPYQVLFVMDPLERINAFYTANPNAITPVDRMVESSGYFIYYEKNIHMHEYMLTNKTVDYTAKPPTFVDLTPVDIQDDFMDEDPEDQSTLYEVPPEPRVKHPEDTIRRHQASSARRRGARTEQKRATSLLASLCGVLLIVSFVMGVGLVRNQDRIDRMEVEIRQLVTAHRNLFTQISNPEFAPVFAEANPPSVPDYGMEAATPSPTAPQDVPVYSPAATQPPEQPQQSAAITEPVTSPAPEPGPPPHAQAYSEQEALVTPIPEAYTIQPGDSLLAISIYFFGDAGMVDAILALNGIDDPDMIVAGRTIALPRRP